MSSWQGVAYTPKTSMPVFIHSEILEVDVFFSFNQRRSLEFNHSSVEDRY